VALFDNGLDRGVVDDRDDKRTVGHRFARCGRRRFVLRWGRRKDAARSRKYR
jgi:hypothetical protein